MKFVPSPADRCADALERIADSLEKLVDEKSIDN